MSRKHSTIKTAQNSGGPGRQQVFPFEASVPVIKTLSSVSHDLLLQSHKDRATQLSAAIANTKSIINGDEIKLTFKAHFQ